MNYTAPSKKLVCKKCGKDVKSKSDISYGMCSKCWENTENK